MNSKQPLNIFKAIEVKDLEEVYKSLCAGINVNQTKHNQTAAEYARSLAGNDPVAIKISHAIELYLFCNLASESLYMFNVYCQLYEESREQCAFLSQCAPPVFAYLQDILHQRTLLDICRFTEEDSNSCTIQYWFNQYLATTATPVGEEASAAYCRMLQIRSFAKPARNKIISHIDRKALLSNAALGGMAPGEDKDSAKGKETINDFYHSLEIFMGEVAAKLYGVPVRPMPLELPCTEGYQLVKLLKLGMEKRKEQFSRRTA